MFTVFTKINDKLEDRKQETIKKGGALQTWKKTNTTARNEKYNN